jgi:hypothetical protein
VLLAGGYQFLFSSATQLCHCSICPSLSLSKQRQQLCIASSSTINPWFLSSVPPLLSLTDKAAGAATRKRDQWVQGWPSGITSSAQGVVGQGEGLAFRSRSSWLEDFALFHLIGWLFPLFVFGFSPKKKKRFFFGFSPRRCVLVPPSLCWLGGREGEGFLLAPGLTALVDFFPARPSPCSTPFWSLLAWLVFWGGGCARCACDTRH